jgi:hypothetical protein
MSLRRIWVLILAASWATVAITPVAAEDTHSAAKPGSGVELEEIIQDAPWLADGFATAVITSDLQIDMAYAIITSLAMEYAGDSYGGGWLDVPGKTISIAIRGQGRARTVLESLQAELGTNDQLALYLSMVVVEPVDASFGELEGAFTEAVATVDGRAPVELDVERNEVVVHAKDAAQKAALTKLGQSEGIDSRGLASVRVTDFGSPVPTACASRTDCTSDKTLRGGISISKSSSSTGCTLGFAANAGSRLISAGHCFTSSPSSWYHKGAKVASHGATVHGAGKKVDAARSGSLTSPWAAKSWIYHTNSNQTFRIDGIYSGTWCKNNCKGLSVNKAGRVSGLHTSTIKSSYVSLDPYGTEGFRLYHDQCKGDSGAPVYTSSGIGVGIAVVGIGDAGYSIGGNKCYNDTGANHIDDVVTQLGLSIP